MNGFMPWLINFLENVYSFMSAPQILLSRPLPPPYFVTFLTKHCFFNPWPSCTQMVTQVLLILLPIHLSNLSVPFLLHCHLLHSTNPFSTLLLERNFNHTNDIISFLIWNLAMAFRCLQRQISYLERHSLPGLPLYFYPWSFLPSHQCLVSVLQHPQNIRRAKGQKHWLWVT